MRDLISSRYLHGSARYFRPVGRWNAWPCSSGGGRAVEKIAFQVRTVTPYPILLLPLSPLLIVLQAYTRNYLSTRCVRVFFFPKSPLLNYTARKGGGRHSPRYGFIAVRGNVGIIRVHVVHQLLRDNGKLEKWTFSLKFLHVVGFCV